MMAMGRSRLHPRRHPMPNARIGWRTEGQASRAERTSAAPSYLPARRVDEAGRVARSNGTVAAQAPTSMTWRSGKRHEPRHAESGTQPSTR